MWKSQSWGMCLGALLECLHFHAGLDTWKMNKSIPERGEKRLSILPIMASGSPGKKQEQEHVCSSPWCPRSSGPGEGGKEGEVSLLSNPLRDSSFATHPGPGQTLERAELTCRVTWSTLSADGSRMLTMPRSVSTRIWGRGSRTLTY